MTFTEQYMNAMLGGRMLDFKHIDMLLEAFKVDIPEEYLKAFTSINHVIRYIYETALKAAQKEVNVTIRYSIEANSLASYVAIQDTDGSWSNVHSCDELVEILEEMKLQLENLKDLEEE